MELYISDHPLDCLTCAANGDCELQDMAGAVGLREVRYGYDGDEPPRPAERHQQPLLHFDPSKCIVCSRCVRACEEIAGDVRPHHPGPRLRLQGRRRARASRSSTRSACRAAPACRSARRPRSPRRRSSSSASPAAACSRLAPTAVSAARSGPRCRATRSCAWCRPRSGGANEGHSCVKGRFAWGYATHPDRVLQPMMRERITDHVARGDAGTRPSPSRPGACSRSRPATASTRSAASPRRAAPTRRSSSSRRWCGPPSATTTSTPAPACATRRPASG